MGKILFPQWESLGQDFIVRAFAGAGYEADPLPFPQAEPDAGKRAGLADQLVKKILAGTYDFVFTVNFLPVVAIACKACRIRYLSWVYDSPCVELYSETMLYETNTVFIFDSQTCMDLIGKGVQTVAYLPMAADVDYYDACCLESATNKYDPDQAQEDVQDQENVQEKYRSDLSFVGSLYTQAWNQFAPLEKAEGYLKGYLDGLVGAQMDIYGGSFLEQALAPEIVLQMQKLCLLPQRVNSSETPAWLYANYYLAKKVTARERSEIIRDLSRQFSLKLYTGESTAQYPEINNIGMVDYYREAPLVYQNSKINLNISLRSIQSGIPLRAFDIMGCGGFLLTNYQGDFMEHFVPGEDFVYYENRQDLAEKVAYYLSHEEERKQIARSGYEKVKQFHTYRHRVAEMLQVINGF